MGLKSKVLKDGRIIRIVDFDCLLFNIGKHICGNQSQLTRWKNKFKKSGNLVKNEDGLIEIELSDECSQENQFKDFEIILNEYPFLYYRAYENDLEVISIIKDIDKLRELIMKDIIMKEKICLNDIVVSYMNKPLNTRVVYEYEEGYIDYYTIPYWLSFGWEKELRVLPTIEFDLYEIEVDGKKTYYTESTHSVEFIINVYIDTKNKVKVFRNGKEVEQGVRFIDVETKAKWVDKGEKLDPRREIHKCFKLIERK